MKPNATLVLVVCFFALSALADDTKNPFSTNQLQSVLNRIESHAQITYATNGGRVSAVMRCADEGERQRVRDAFMQITGGVTSTKEPPTVRVSLPMVGISRAEAGGPTTRTAQQATPSTVGSAKPHDSDHTGLGIGKLYSVPSEVDKTVRK